MAGQGATDRKCDDEPGEQVVNMFPLTAGPDGTKYEEILMLRMSSSARRQAGEQLAGAGAVQPVEVLLVYEDLSTGLRGRAALDQIERQLDPPARLKMTLWKFDLLNDPLLLEEAANAAARADIVFLSAHGKGDLPAWVRRWFDQWLERKRSRVQAMALSLDSTPRGDADSLVTGLREAAESAGTEFFVHSGAAFPNGAAATPPKDRHPRRGGQASSLSPETPRDHPYRDWGLNE